MKLPEYKSTPVFNKPSPIDPSPRETGVGYNSPTGAPIEPAGKPVCQNTSVDEAFAYK